MATSAPAYAAVPIASLHYTGGDAPGGVFASAAASIGFNMAVSSASAASTLPAGVKALVWLGLCNGADSTFMSTLSSFIGNSKVYGFYLMDEPDPTGQYAPLCTAANLKAESDWIHANVPGTKTFIVMMNLGTPTSPSYANTYNPTNTDIDLFGLDPYPVRPQFTGGVNYGVINAGVSAAEAEGIPLADIVPVFQAFGGGNYTSYTLPTPAQEQQILATWEGLVPTAAFDDVYNWGVQEGDTALSDAPSLEPVFSAYFGSGGTGSTGGGTGSGTSTSPAPCNNYYQNGVAIPSGYGAAYDLADPSSLLISASCDSATLVITVGDNNPNDYVYDQGYVYVNNSAGTGGWQPLALTSSNTLAGNAWYPKIAQANIPSSVDLSNWTYAVGYTCRWSGTAWLCGCAAAACSTGYWQLQAFKR